MSRIGDLPTVYVLALLCGAVALHIARSRQRLALLSLYCRVILGLVFFTAGWSKLSFDAGLHAPSIIGPVQLITLLEPHGLGLFARFVAFCQAGVGLLLLSERCALLASIMLLPMLLCIEVVTISLKWSHTPWVVAVFLLMNVFLLGLHWQRLKFILLEPDPEMPRMRAYAKMDRIDGVWLAAACLILAGLISEALTRTRSSLTLMGLLGISIAGLSRRVQRLRAQ